MPAHAAAAIARLRLGERHLAEAPGGCPFLALPNRRRNRRPFDVLLNLGGANHVGHFIAVDDHGTLREWKGFTLILQGAIAASKAF